MTTRTLRNGDSRDLPIEPGQSMAVVAVSGTYSASVIAGLAAPSTIATNAIGGTYGPYATGAVIRLQSSAASEIDFDVDVMPAIVSDTHVFAQTDAATGGVSLVAGDGEITALRLTNGLFSLVGASGNSLTINVNNIPDDTDLQLLGPLNLTQSTSGLTSALSAVPAAVTGSQPLSLPEAGTYVLEAVVSLNFAAATFAALQAVTAYLRRTNNTASDITGSVSSSVLPIMTTLTLLGDTLHLGPVIYTTSNVDDTIAVFASLTLAPSAGACQVTNTHITARRA